MRDVDDLTAGLQEVAEAVEVKASVLDVDQRLRERLGEDGAVSVSELERRLADLREDLASNVELGRKMGELRDEILQAGGDGGKGSTAPADLGEGVDRALQLLRVGKADRSELLEKLEVHERKIVRDLGERAERHESDVSDSFRIVHDDVAECRRYIDAMESRVAGSADVVAEDPDQLDERIRQAADVMRKSLLRELSDRIEGLRAVEVEVEKLASKLADKPDQEQIDAMLGGLEGAFAQRMNPDEALRDFFDNMKLGKPYICPCRSYSFLNIARRPGPP